MRHQNSITREVKKLVRHQNSITREQNLITRQLLVARVSSKFDHVRGKKAHASSKFDHAPASYCSRVIKI